MSQSCLDSKVEPSKQSFQILKSNPTAFSRVLILPVNCPSTYLIPEAFLGASARPGPG